MEGRSTYSCCVVQSNELDPYLKDVRIILRDNNTELIESWKAYWASSDNEKGLGGLSEEQREFIDNHVEIGGGDIFSRSKDELIEVDAIVSPANSFGFMDGGIDMVYSKRFGWQLMERLQDVIKQDYDGELLVGQAIVIETRDPKNTIKYLISAPTMRVPENVSKTPNAYLAFRATLLAVRRHNQRIEAGTSDGEPIRSILCCGLGTAVGLMPADRCAYQMFQGYVSAMWGYTFPYADLAGYQQQHHQLTTHRK